MRNRILRFLAAVLLVVLLGGAAFVAWAYPRYQALAREASAFDLAEVGDIPAISEVFDIAGQPYSRLEGQARYVVGYDNVSILFFQALIAREDSRFHEHNGVDPVGIARAAWRNFTAGGVREGASTITQQLARNTFDLGNDRWHRKAVEALLAMRIERSIGKRAILEAYVNRIYFGVGLYGVETAARACFGKSAKDLTLAEAATLAGLIRSPNRLSPLEDSRAAVRQRDQVLARMLELKMVTVAEAEAARREPLPDTKRFTPRVQENYAMDAIERDLENVLPRDVIARGGLKIYTTIDRRLQLLAEQALESRLAAFESQPGWPHPRRGGAASPSGAGAAGASPYLQGALVAMDSRTGDILAIVGGRDFRDSPFNRAILARRQVGSTFKPFVYAAAFERGMWPSTPVDDSPIVESELADYAGAWSPENSDGDNLGMLPAEEGLIRSRNTMTVRVAQFAGSDAIGWLAGHAGLRDVPRTPAACLGAFEATLKDITAAYTVFSNSGVKLQPTLIDHVVDRHGRTVFRATRGELRCLHAPVADTVGSLLQAVLHRGTGASAYGELGLAVPAAGKTGTTDDYKDAWFVGYTNRITCGVWVGMDRPETIASRGYGSKLALPVWVDFMNHAAEWKYVASELPKAPNIEAQIAGAPRAEPVTVAVAQPVSASLPVAPVADSAPPAPGTQRYRVVQRPGGITIEYGP